MPEQLDVTVDGVGLGVRVWPAADPSRPPVVLLPATGETAEDWDVVASSLHSSRTVYAVSLRGHGPSDWPGHYSIRAMADDVTGLLRQLGDRPVDLVGHSLGGLVACAVASAHPELLRRLVLEDVGVPHARPAAVPPRPPGDLPFDWRVVEQVRPEIDDPDPRWSAVVAGIAPPRSSSPGARAVRCRRNTSPSSSAPCRTAGWSPSTRATSCTPRGRTNSSTT